jgi:hypothetical protein
VKFVEVLVGVVAVCIFLSAVRGCTACVKDIERWQKMQAECVKQCVESEEAGG